MAKRSSDSDCDSAASAASSGGSESKKQKAEIAESVRLLKELLKERDQEITKLRAEKKVLQQTVRRQKSRLDKMEGQLEEERSSKQKSLDIKRVADKTGHVGKSGSWLTPSGSVSLAVSSHLFSIPGFVIPLFVLFIYQ